LFRVVVTVEAVMTFTQAVFAGGFLSGHYELLGLHADYGRITGYAAVAQLITAILLWRPGRGPGWPVLVCTLLLGAVGSQIYLGFARILSIHVPLGVAVITGSVLLVIWAWKPMAPSPETPQ